MDYNRRELIDVSRTLYDEIAKNSSFIDKCKPLIFVCCVKTIQYLLIFVNTKVYVTKILLDIK